MLGVVLAAGAMFAVGLIDDVRDMSAPGQDGRPGPGGQHPVLRGVTMYELKIPLAGFFVLTPGIVPLITAVWVIALTNAVNLIDGLDGLAAGVVAIGGGALARLRPPPHGARPPPERQHRAARGRDRLRDLPRLPALQLQPGPHLHGRRRRALPGSAHGGLDDGHRRPGPHRGAHQRRDLLLLRPAVHPAASSWGCRWSTWPSPSCAARPAGRGFDTPDKEHIHHRLLRLGHGPRRSVLILWAWTAILSGFLLFPLFVHQVNAFIPLGAAALGVALYTFFHPGLRRGDGDDEEDDALDQGIPCPRDEAPERVSEVVRFPS